VKDNYDDPEGQHMSRLFGKSGWYGVRKLGVIYDKADCYI